MLRGIVVAAIAGAAFLEYNPQDRSEGLRDNSIPIREHEPASRYCISDGRRDDEVLAERLQIMRNTPAEENSWGRAKYLRSVKEQAAHNRRQYHRMIGSDTNSFS